MAARSTAYLFFYTDGVKLVCEGSPVLDHLRKFESQAVDVISCRTCIEYFALTEKVRVGTVGPACRPSWRLWRGPTRW